LDLKKNVINHELKSFCIMC